MKASMNRSPDSRLATSAGFTLIELMVTIAVLGIIVSIAAPNISTQLANQRVKSTTATLENALTEARIESAIRRQNITLTYNNNGANAGTITIANTANTANIASYRYDAKSTIKAAADKVEFKPNKTANESRFTICDSNTSASPRQVTVSALGLISSQTGGSCP